MSENSEAGNLILANQHLSELGSPYRDYYAYYKLAEKLKDKLDALFFDPPLPFLRSIGHDLPAKASAYLCHDTPTVGNQAILNLRQLLGGFLGYGRYKKKIERPPFEGLDWKQVDDLFEKYEDKWGSDINIGAKTKIGDFWRRARVCNLKLNQSEQKGHTSLDLMDLISACSGYKDFSDFVQKEFGDDYDPAKDDTLQTLIMAASESVGSAGEKGGLERSKAEIPDGRITVSGYLSKERMFKLKRRLPVLLLSLFAGLSIFVLTGRAKETQVTVALTTRYLHFQTHQETPLRSTNKFLMASSKDFYIRNAVFTLDYPYSSDTTPSNLRIKPAPHALVGFEHVHLPKGAGITLETPTSQDMYLGFSESVGLHGFVPINHVMVYSPEEMDSVVYGQNPAGMGINFQTFKDQPNHIALIGAEDFEWPPFYVNSLSFGQLKQDQVAYEIESAQIHFLKNDRKIQISPKDLLSVAFEDPVKIQVKYSEGLVSLQFTGLVNSIYAGPDIFGRSHSNNQMPKLWEVRKDLMAVAVLLTILLLPAVMMSQSRTKRFT
jgi:hypothetical protein